MISTSVSLSLVCGSHHPPIFSKNLIIYLSQMESYRFVCCGFKLLVSGYTKLNINSTKFGLFYSSSYKTS